MFTPTKVWLTPVFKELREELKTTVKKAHERKKKKFGVPSGKREVLGVFYGVKLC